MCGILWKQNINWCVAYYEKQTTTWNNRCVEYYENKNIPSERLRLAKVI